MVLGQMRPNNRPTLVDQDLVGQTVNESQWTLVAQCLHTGEIVRGSIHHPILGEQVPVENIPVRFEGRIIGALLRVSLAPLKGPTSMYERTYLDVFERLADMVAQSAFPFPDEDVGTEEAPRVGDGVVVVDADGRVEFASPNAMNAFHRMGIYTQPEGRRFGDLDIEESAVEWALATGRPVVEEVERRPDVIVLVHCIPLLSHGVVTGAMILLRDVTDVRRLDRLLLSKDAAIREVHHRVKNNLQTISSLLSLQARRVGDRAARVALQRGRAPGALHRAGARDPLARPERPGALRRDRRLAGADGRGLGGLVAADRDRGPRRPRRGGGRRGHAAGGDGGRAAAERRRARLRPRERRRAATARPGSRARAVRPATRRWATSTSRCPTRTRRCGVEVRDDGLGLPEGFDIERTTSLGLSIVRDLVVSQLEGTISMEAVPPAGRGRDARGDLGAGAGAPVSGRRAATVGGAAQNGGALRAAGGQPRLAQLAALLLGGAAPDAGLLVGGQREVEAGLERLAGTADALGRLDLVDGRAGRADGEEEVRFGVAAGGRAPPVVRVPIDGPVPHESHRNVPPPAL